MTGADITGRAAPPPHRPAGDAVRAMRTARLTLRAHAPGDWPAFRTFYASEDARILGGPHGAAHAWTLFAADAGHWALHGFGWFVLDDGTGAVGTCGLHRPPHHDELEIGWITFAPARGRGYATEAARAVLDRFRAAFAGERIVSYIDAGNAASRAVARKLGATDTGARARHDPQAEIWSHGRAA